MLILLPPSEGKTAPGRGKPLDLAALSFPTLERQRAEVLDALVALCADGTPDTAVRTLGLGPTQADAVAANARLRTAATARADRVYSGVLYEALDLPGLDAGARRRATAWLAITSGLFGLLRPADRIPAYRLSGDVSLPGVGAVSTYWRRHLDGAVREAVGRGLLLDLRSTTYASFWRPQPDLARRVATLRVLHEKDGRRTVVSHFNKATKGRIVRAMLEDGATPTTPARLAHQLERLGWDVEVDAAGPHGTRLDVVVREL